MTASLPAAAAASFRAQGGGAVAAVCAGLMLLSGCSPDGGLRVESPQGQPVPSASEQAEDLPVDVPFSAAEIREAAVSDATLTNDGTSSQVLETLLYCTECLTLSQPLVVGDETFQLAMVSAPRNEQHFAGLVVGADDGEPTVELVVSGTDLTLTPGQGGTLVAQESLYRDGDARCCPSGWSVRVYRYHGGQFEAGQRISRNSSE
ncbi:hypothetical protein [Brevibacterium otitidis]|uniref:Lipoprotein n=1 Tax=Brevibacterium otitidis TaxID=53364 RepID=A0ABV5X3J1_9MICO